jgi:hypothetical protein
LARLPQAVAVTTDAAIIEPAALQVQLLAAQLRAILTALAVLTLLHRLVRHQSQLIIATHSPILLAYPHARIYEFSAAGINPIAYEDTEHFRVTRDFLAQRERMIELLLREEEDGD